ncbi:MAG: hypothetical protein O2955_03270 [Planctomycetota bacterium]|nr:hypothetical protein [Planctomycetota bacterium]MDA1211509.1 hypothetical protein [Planctomycetota bacterium]
MGLTNEIERPWNRLRLRAPHESPGWLERPPIVSFRDVLTKNLKIIRESDGSIAGIPLLEFRRRCREEVAKAAQSYAEEFGWEVKASRNEADLPWIVTGHQPIMAHPGVWSKNFAAHWMARNTNGVALNLIVDNDLLTTPAISVPSLNDNRLTVHTIPFVEQLSRAPWEEIDVSDSDSAATLFADFGSHLSQWMRERWKINPLMDEYWPTVLKYRSFTHRLSHLLSAARHEVELRWGVNNLELPISRMCGLPTCQLFVGHILHHARSFAEIHNLVLAEYRQLYRIRSSTHPVPVLKIDDDVCEVPFWIWKAGESQRRRLFVQYQKDLVVLWDGRKHLGTLSAPQTPEAVIETLCHLETLGYRLRMRALTTTLFARLGIGDLFIHGIGGAQYDEITDRIMSRFFGIRGPQFFTLTSTLHLPLDSVLGTESRIGNDEVGDASHKLRDFRYNPDRYLAAADDATVAALIAEKYELCRQQREIDALPVQTASQRREHRAENHRRYRRLREINERLLPFLAEQVKVQEAQMLRLQDRARDQRIRYNREFAVWLYPEALLRSFYARFLPASK